MTATARQPVPSFDPLVAPVGEPTPCPVCAYADAHGHWGPIAPARSHCRGCHRAFGPSLREAHCTVCHRHFASPDAFDGHRKRGRCHDPASRTYRDGSDRFVARRGPFGEVWRLRSRKPLPESFRS